MTRIKIGPILTWKSHEDKLELPVWCMSSRHVVHSVRCYAYEPDELQMMCGTKLVNPLRVNAAEGPERQLMLSDRMVAQELKVCLECSGLTGDLVWVVKAIVEAQAALREHYEKEESFRIERRQLDEVRFKMNELIEDGIRELADKPMSELGIDFGKVTLREFLATMQNDRLIRRYDMPREPMTAADIEELIDG